MTPTRLRLQKRNGARDGATEIFFMRVWVPALARESFLTAESITERPAPRRKAGTWESIAAVPFVIAGKEVASKRWPRDPRSHGEPGKSLSKISILCSGKWLAETFRRSAAKW